MQIVTRTELSNKTPSYQGKVRDLYDLGDQLLISPQTEFQLTISFYPTVYLTKVVP